MTRDKRWQAKLAGFVTRWKQFLSLKNCRSVRICSVLNRSNRDTTMYYCLIFCAFSWPNMVKWRNSGIISCLILLPYFRLRGTASYQFTGGIKSLFLDGRAGYAEIPAIDFPKRNFSISIRFNVQDTHQIGHLISDWSSPFQFGVFIINKKIRAVLRRVHNRDQFLFVMETDR